MDHLSGAGSGPGLDLGPDRGPVRGADLKLPGLLWQRQLFAGHGRVLGLLTRVEVEVAVGEEPSIGRVAAIGVAVEGPDGLAPGVAERTGWQTDGERRWVWRADPRVVLTSEMIEGAGRLDGSARRRFVLLRDGSGSDRQALQALLEGDAPGAGRDVDVRPATIPTAAVADAAEVMAAAAAVRGRPLLAVTGAGLSAAAGILPFFGPDSLDRALGLLEPFPGRLTQVVVDDPLSVTTLLARWHLAFLAAEPTSAHVALADLERRGHLAGTLTTNVDRLHHLAGAHRVAETPAISRALPPAEAGVLAVGCANDPGGVLARARAAGGVIIILNDTTPAWARSGDLLVRGDPQDTVPALAAAVEGLRSPLTGLGDGWIAESELEAVPPARMASLPAGPWAVLPHTADELRARVAARRSRVHGPRHWLTVAWIGAALAAADDAVDPLVVALFALFHDCARTHDGHDPEHGRRGAAVAREALDGVDWVTREQRELLEEACADHTAGWTSEEPTIGACWDADRLDLWRVGATPSPALLSRPASAGLRGWARRFTEVGNDDAAWDDWRPVSAAYAALAAR